MLTIHFKFSSFFKTNVKGLEYLFVAMFYYFNSKKKEGKMGTVSNFTDCISVSHAAIKNLRPSLLLLTGEEKRQIQVGLKSE
jgi:hypothetical protein